MSEAAQNLNHQPISSRTQVDGNLFQIDLVSDRHRFFPLLAYALACEKENPQLAQTLRQHVFVPLPYARTEAGYWYHPAFPNVGNERDLFDLEKWLRRHKMRAEFVTIPETQEGQSILESMDYAESASCIAWEPTPPSDPNFFLFAIYPTEYGPYACYIAPELPQQARSACACAEAYTAETVSC
jgi:hypothetical protein